MKIRLLLDKALREYSHWCIRRSKINHIRECMKRNQIPNKAADGEIEYIRLWSTLAKKVEPYSYRFFANYMGKVPYIVPEDIGHFFIESKLNPIRYRDFYSDKNLYSQYMDIKDNLPMTYVRRVDGGPFLNANFDLLKNKGLDISDEDLCNILSKARDLILKPSVDTDSGVGVRKFYRKQNGYFDSDNKCLTVSYLKNVGNDFILQEAVPQHDFFSRLCKTSVNTMRLCLYRSVVNEKIILTGGVVRIGADGAFVDNAHAGGRFVGIDVQSGTLKESTYDQYGISQIIWNGIDYSKEKMIIPFWKEIREFAEYVAKQNRHCRLIALDVALNPEGRPVLIEENIGGFSYWLLELTGQDPFAGRIQEVIDFCKKDFA